LSFSLPFLDATNVSETHKNMPSDQHPPLHEVDPEGGDDGAEEDSRRAEKGDDVDSVVVQRDSSKDRPDTVDDGSSASDDCEERIDDEKGGLRGR